MNRRNIAQQAVDFILTRKLEELADLTGAKIAGALGVKTDYLTQKFKDRQHITLHGFILREKLHRAAFVLGKKQDLTIVDLASKLGFSKPGHFDMAFNRYFAIEPDQYRNLKTGVL
jgi:AraC-like DNA-binding protein